MVIIKDDLYLKPQRLNDIIRLITVLAIEEERSFRAEVGLTSALKGTPNSSTSWLKLAKEHPEFFRMGKNEESVILSIRYFLNPKRNEEGTREPLTVEQTQKTIDQVIALHDKQLARYQRNSFRIPMYAAIMAAIVTILVACINLFALINNNENLNSKFDKINMKLDSILTKTSNKSH